VIDALEESEYGRFGWAVDPEGTRFEIWEPPPATDGRDRRCVTVGSETLSLASPQAGHG